MSMKMQTRNLAAERAKYNLPVNAINPGYIATDQTAPTGLGGHTFNEFIVDRIPAGRWGDPACIIGAAIPSQQFYKRTGYLYRWKFPIRSGSTPTNNDI